MWIYFRVLHPDPLIHWSMSFSFCKYHNALITIPRVCVCVCVCVCVHTLIFLVLSETLLAESWEWQSCLSWSLFQVDGQDFFCAGNVKTFWHCCSSSPGLPCLSEVSFTGLLCHFTVISFTNMPANLENSAVATRLEKVTVHSNNKERQWQRIFKLLHSCTHLTC